MPVPICPLPDAGRIAVTGRSGRVARLVRRVWGDSVRWHGRADGALAPRLAGCAALVCLAGVTSGSADTLRGNVTSALGALDAASEAGLRRVVLMSSAAIYGRVDCPVHEARAPRPVAPYGASKVDMERAVRHWRRSRPDGPDVVILRVGNIAGADALLGNLRDDTHPALTTFGDGTTPRRSYIGPLTLARVLARIALHPGPLPDVMNVAAPGTVAMADLLAEAGRTWRPVPADSAAIPSVDLDVGTLSRLHRVPHGSAATLVSEWQACAGQAA
ncbi:NAD(P)-dependent oxidoreductase [uncultured Jannaschia sp.]|uniref:NAD-dependent epimerase/dehydratase family protein n=1 Tax=uncultured Jannaschia sp. TaxID=293347 RepID=UPI002630B72A|nr:NAD-dependent epimerase/dehydratase family protein [uncultured Jannaschia sp.]